MRNNRPHTSQKPSHTAGIIFRPHSRFEVALERPYRVRLDGMTSHTSHMTHTTHMNTHQSQQVARPNAAVNVPYRSGADSFGVPCPSPVYRAPNAAIVLSASGGLGTSTFAALLAQTLHGLYDDRDCALVDADLSGGGLDVLLGMESELGVLLNAVTAPLGEVDGAALRRRLTAWDGVDVLSSRPWICPMPQDWEIAVTVCALAEMYDMVVVDAGRAGYSPGEAIPLPLKGSAMILLVELSVLGTVRAQACIEALTGRGSRRSSDHRAALANRTASGTVTEDDIALVGVLPLTARASARGVIGVDEAAEYLGIDVLCSIQPDARLCAAILEGTGLLKPNRANMKALRTVASWLDARRAGSARPTGSGKRR